MSSPLVLSLFPGIGLLDMAFEERGFCVVRGPDLLWGGDIRRFHPPAGKFDGVIGGPPCQAHSRLAHLVRAVHGPESVAEDLIPEFARVVNLAAPAWFLMENVPDAPTPSCPAFCIDEIDLHDYECGGVTSRRRRFFFGTKYGMVLEIPRLPKPAFVLQAVVCDARSVPVALGGSGKLKRTRQGHSGTAPHEGKRLPVAEMLRRQGAPPDLLASAAFTESAKREMAGNGVPLPMGRAVADAVWRAVYRDGIARMEG